MANANFRLRRALFTLHGIICATHFHIFGSGERHPTDPGTPERTGGQQEDSPAHMWKPRPERRAEAGTRSYNNCSPSCSHAHIPRTPASDARARSSGKQPSLAAVPQPHTFHTGVEYRGGLAGPRSASDNYKFLFRFGVIKFVIIVDLETILSIFIWQDLELVPTLARDFAGSLVLGHFWLELCWLEIFSNDIG